MVYILEAHPTDVWQMRSNLKDNVLFASPKSQEERALVAGACVRKLGIKFPAVLDEFGNSTERAYTGWPDRLYLIDSKGQVAYKSQPGPFGFKPDELATALKRIVQPNQTLGLMNRAPIVLLSASGTTNLEIAQQLKMTNATVGKWRRYHISLLNK